MSVLAGHRYVDCCFERVEQAGYPAPIRNRSTLEGTARDRGTGHATDPTVGTDHDNRCWCQQAVREVDLEAIWGLVDGPDGFERRTGPFSARSFQKYRLIDGVARSLEGCHGGVVQRPPRDPRHPRSEQYTLRSARTQVSFLRVPQSSAAAIGLKRAMPFGMAIVYLRIGYSHCASHATVCASNQPITGRGWP
jgi:hypothetical protein